MRIVSQAPKNAITTSLVEGSVSRYDGHSLAIAVGELKPQTRRKFILLMRKVVATAKQYKVKSFSLAYKDIKALSPKQLTPLEIAELAAVAFMMAAYEHTTYKTKPKDGWNTVETIAILEAPQECAHGFSIGVQVGEKVNACRELSNAPGGHMTPKILANAARAAVKGTKAKVKVLGRKEMQRLGMGAVLGIAQGSSEEPQFIVVEYLEGLASQKPVVLVGKGVTFDTGGLQVKPGDHMYEMHMDMSGGASVIHAVALAAKLKLKVNAVALVPAVENSPSGSAVRPGDILRSLSGKTIEILHTDAEGRVILADAITYAKRYNPSCVVDVATLTGAAIVALGLQASALMSNQQAFEDKLRGLGEESGDYLWPMPLWEEYDEMVKGRFADVPNISTFGNSRDGGVIAGGKFLEVFAKELKCPWAHLDIAPKMTAAPNEFLSKGAAGAPVRLLLAILRAYAH